MSQSQNLNVFIPEIPSMNQRQHWLTEMICMNTSQRIMEVDGQGNLNRPFWKAVRCLEREIP